jgi:hypothetical protein
MEHSEQASRFEHTDSGLRTVQGNEYVAHSQLGLGMKSKFHASLSIAKNIALQTYSFFQGIDSAISVDSRDGSLTIGGYGEALLSDGSNTTTKFNHEVWKRRESIKVDPTGLHLQSDGRGTQNILDSSKKLEACVVPTLSSLLWLPEHYWFKVADGRGTKLSTLNNSTFDKLFYGVASVQPNTSYALRSSQVRHSR